MKPMRTVGSIIADIRATAAIGPSPEFLRVLIAQQRVAVRNAARRNDPDSDATMPGYEQLRDQLKAMQELLPRQVEAYRLRRLAERRAAFERMMARHDPAERKAAIDAINAGFGDRPARPWQDDMSGVGNPDAVGASD